jgi:hypothetical protein
MDAISFTNSIAFDESLMNNTKNIGIALFQLGKELSGIKQLSALFRFQVKVLFGHWQMRRRIR